MRFLCLVLLSWFLLQSSIHSLAVNKGTAHLDTAHSFVGVKEKSGRNDGPEVEMFLRSVGRKKGDAWCAAFVSYCLTKGDVKEPKIRSGLARAFKLKNSIKANDVLTGRIKIKPGAIVIWQKGNTVFGHTGFVESWNTNEGITIEGNTSPGNSGRQSDGDGVYRKKRNIMPGNYFRITAFTEVIKNYHR